jgi:hypothetical protein
VAVEHVRHLHRHDRRVFRLRDHALEALGLESERVSAIHAWREGDAVVVLAGSYGSGLSWSEDGDRTWSRVDAGLSASAFRFLVPDPRHPGTLLAGTEPARIFRSEDGGLTGWSSTGSPASTATNAGSCPIRRGPGAVRNVYAPPGPQLPTARCRRGRRAAQRR